MTVGQIVEKLKLMPLASADARWLRVLEIMAERGPLRFYEFVSEKLVEVATPDPRFYSLLGKLDEEGVGAFAVSLIEIGAHNRDAQRIFEGIKNNRALMSAKGFLFGGICIARPAESIIVLREAMNSSDESERVFASQAFKIAGEAFADNSDAVDILARGEKDPNGIVKSNTLACYLKMYKADKKT